jgi:hypothetical protein
MISDRDGGYWVGIIKPFTLTLTLTLTLSVFNQPKNHLSPDLKAGFFSDSVGRKWFIESFGSGRFYFLKTSLEKLQNRGRAALIKLRKLNKIQGHQ